MIPVIKLVADKKKKQFIVEKWQPIFLKFVCSSVLNRGTLHHHGQTANRSHSLQPQIQPDISLLFFLHLVHPHFLSSSPLLHLWFISHSIPKSRSPSQEEEEDRSLIQIYKCGLHFQPQVHQSMPNKVFWKVVKRWFGKEEGDSVGTDIAKAQRGGNRKYEWMEGV